MNAKIKVTIVLLSVMLTGLWSCSQNSASQEQTQEEQIPVEVIPVERGTIQRTLNLYGDVQAKQQVRVFSKISDRITRLQVDMGDRVQKGDLLAVVENSTLRSRVDQMEANLEQAQSQLENLKREYQRLQELYAEDAVSQQQFDQTRTQLESTRAQVRSLEASLRQVRTQLDESYLRSPIDGIIGDRFLDQGDMITPQSPVVTVVQMDTIEVVVNVIERYTPEITIGLPVEITVNALPDTVFRGYVNKVSPVVDPMARMITVEVEIPNAGRVLRPGMFAEVSIILDSHENVLTVPKYAVLHQTKLQRTASGRRDVIRNYHVFTIQDGRARMRSITTGIEDPSEMEVLSGLNEGDSLVIQGHNALEDSTKVNVVTMGGRS